MIRKATWICGLSLLLAGSAFAQYVSDVAAETTDAAIENQPGWVNPEVKDYEFNDQAGYEGTVRVGDWFSGATSTNNACLVIPFRLPDAGIVSDPFTSADFSFYLQENTLSVGLSSYIDLYIVRTAPSNTVLSSDYYQGSAEANGTRIVNSFVSLGTVASNTISTSVAGLLTALNTAYNGGAGAGEYVFFRLNYGLDGWAPQNDRIVAATRGNADSAKWPRLTLTDNVDQDSDGLPDTWEIFYFGDVAIGSGLYVGTSDFELDGLNNAAEYAAGTDPTLADTDDDGLTDDEELNVYSTDPLDSDSDDDFLSDGDEVNIHGSDPLDIDSDNDNVNDATEVSCGSDPTLPGDVPANVLPQMIGADFFDYANNPTNPFIFSLAGGEFFDIDNNTLNDTYVGHTCDISDWYDTDFNSGEVSNQGLVTSGDRLALRSFNGLNTGGQSIGVFSTDPATGSTSSNLYFKVKMIESGTVEYAGLSFYDGDSEQLFFGKTGGNGFWGIDDYATDPASTVTETYGPTNDVEYTIVGKIDIPSASVILWIDPVIASGEFAATPIVSPFLAGSGPWKYNAMRLASGGPGDVRWDDLVVAYTWDGLNFAGTDSDVDGLRDTWELIWTNDLAVLFSGNDADGDGLNDEVELGLLTDPTSLDTDADGLSDSAEVNTYFTDPADADTDDDGLTDGEEVNTYTTDPLDEDSDDDLFSDGVEVAAGTDPNDPNSNPGSVIVDGSKDALYGDPVAIQTIETGFGDNLSELNAAYAFSTNATLCLMLTGNLENNGNTLEIFIDSSGGVNSNVLDAVGGDNVNNLDGLTFDTGFEPDYHIWFKQEGGGLTMWVADLVTSNTSTYTDIFGGSFEGSGSTGTGDANATPIEVAFDNSNAAGIGGTTGAAADTNAAVAVTTGMELCIALSDIGSPPTGTIKVAALINNGSHDYLSNQTLGGLPVGTGNLGAVGAPSTIDFSTSYVGDQFFTVDVVAEVAVGPYSITDIELINGNTEVQLILNGLTVGVDYKIRDSVDLTAGFTDVAGSQFTATSETAESVVLPADTSTEPDRFFDAATAP